MESILFQLAEFPRVIAYLIIFLIVFVEGEVILILAGILVRQHYLGFLTVLLVAFVASILHDMLYWWLGVRIKEMHRKKFLFIHIDHIGKVLNTFKDKSGLYIFIAKFTWGLTRLALIAAGYAKRPIQDIIRYSVVASLIWTVTLVSLGYVFASETHLLRKDIRTATLLVTGFVLGVLLVEYLVRKLVREKL